MPRSRPGTRRAGAGSEAARDGREQGGGQREARNLDLQPPQTGACDKLEAVLLTIGPSTPLLRAHTCRGCGLGAARPPSRRPLYLSPCLVLEGGGCRTVWFPSISTTHLVFSSSSGSRREEAAAEPSIRAAGPPGTGLPRGGSRAGDAGDAGGLRGHCAARPRPGPAAPAALSPPPPRGPHFAKLPPPSARPQMEKKERAESSSPRRFMGRTRTATFTLVSDMLAAPARPEAAPHAPRRRRRSRAPPERGRRRSAVCSARQRRGARAIPGERDAGHGRARGGAGARGGARRRRRRRRGRAVGGRAAGPRRRSSRAGRAERAAPRPLAPAPGWPAPPSSAPRPAGPPGTGKVGARSAAGSPGGNGERRGAWGRGGRTPAGAGVGVPGPRLREARPRGARGRRLERSPPAGRLSPADPAPLGVPGGQAFPTGRNRLDRKASTPPPPRAPHRRAAGFSDGCGGPTQAGNESVRLTPAPCVGLNDRSRSPSLPVPSRPFPATSVRETSSRLGGSLALT